VLICLQSSAHIRDGWTDSGMIKKSNIIGKLILKVPEVEVMYYHFNLIALNFYTAFFHYTGHRGN